LLFNSAGRSRAAVSSNLTNRAMRASRQRSSRSGFAKNLSATPPTATRTAVTLRMRARTAI